jgi:hypothetical protein
VQRFAGDSVQLEIEIPPKEQIVREGCAVGLARKGVSWKESCLGEKAKETGVYVIHHAGLIKYVGKTDAPTMSFGIRLRREFQESASGGKHLYPKLAALAVPPEIMVTLFPGSDLKRLVRPSGMTLGSLEAIEIFETALIQVYDPEFQHHHVNRTATYMKKRGFTREQLAAVTNRSSGIAK